MASEKNTSKQLDRRSLLKGASIALGAAGVTSATAKAAPPADADQTPQAGYIETEHVRTYYKLARF